MIALKCPVCGAGMTLKNNKCTCGFQYRVYEDNVISFINETSSDDMALSHNKWEELYKSRKPTELISNLNAYKDTYFQDTYEQLNEIRLVKDSAYLEIGCGEFSFGALIAGEAQMIIGVDFSLAALMTARKLMELNNIENYLLIHADINNLPIADNQIDIIYGGGVIEHFSTTEKVLSELYRVLKETGISFNTVPYLNLASLTYRQKWGNIPDAPVLRPIFEFIHMKLLKGRHMVFGYEKSFTASKMIRAHRKAGFTYVKVDRFKVKLIFEFLPSFLRKISTLLSNNLRIFWPMIKVIGRK